MTRPEVVGDTDDVITEVLDRKAPTEKLLRTIHFTPDEVELLLESVQIAKYPDKARKPSLDKFERLDAIPGIRGASLMENGLSRFAIILMLLVFAWLGTRFAFPRR